MALVGADRTLERDENTLRALSSLRLTPLDNGMNPVGERDDGSQRRRFDPEAAAVLSAALDPLCAPNPRNTNGGEANGGRDPRQADRRRADS